ncbi:MAG: 23S rRNA (adenine(1618)-N(6))-methyltransferase RlmF [Parashewanella sp.]
MSKTQLKGKLHPRSLHNAPYNFIKLVAACPLLKDAVITTPTNQLSINFANPQSVRLLNQALLALHYDIKFWTLAEGFLCPPIPGRVDMLHYLADLLAESKNIDVATLKQRQIKALDIGCGANLIYPLLGNKVYNWQFIASDIHQPSINAATELIQANGLQRQIECRLQANSQRIFHGVLNKNEYVDLTLCNPPFHRSAAEAAEGSQRKQSNLQHNRQQRTGTIKSSPSNRLNFAGKNNELWCDGGESAFVRRMIAESRDFAEQVGWFTSLVAKKDNLPAIKQALKKAQVKEHRIINMSQGQKISRVICWRF